MSTDFLSMLQLSDSFFPTGAYTMSNGLEALFKKKKIKERELQRIIQVFLVVPLEVSEGGRKEKELPVGQINDK